MIDFVTSNMQTINVWLTVLFYYTGFAIWTVIAAFLFCLIAYQLWMIVAAFWFLVRRFRALKRGGFHEHYNRVWIFFSRWFMYAFVPSWRLDYVEDIDTNVRVYWPFCGPDDWRHRTQWFERIRSNKD